MKFIVISLTWFLGFSSFWGLFPSPCIPLWVSPLCWGPQLCPPEPQGHVSHMPLPQEILLQSHT